MKHLIQGIVTIEIVVLFFVAILTINTRTQREAEVRDALNTSVKEALVNIQEDRKYNLYGTTQDELNREFVADFTELLLNDIQSGSGDKKDPNLNVKVEVAGVDYEKGLLSVKVTETFTYPMFGTGETSVSTTALIDTNYDNEVYTITYYEADGVTIYQQFMITVNQPFITPTSLPEGYTYWKDSKGNKVTTWPTKAKENSSYVAAK